MPHHQRVAGVVLLRSVAAAREPMLPSAAGAAGAQPMRAATEQPCLYPSPVDELPVPMCWESW